MDIKLLNVKNTLILEANQKLPIVIAEETAVFGTPELVDPSVVTLTPDGPRNSRVDVLVNGGTAAVTMNYNRLNLGTLFDNMRQPIWYTGIDSVTAYLDVLNAYADVNIRAEDIVPEMLSPHVELGYVGNLTAADSSLAYYGGVQLRFQIPPPAPSLEGDPNNLLIWWPLDKSNNKDNYNDTIDPLNPYISWIAKRNPYWWTHPGAVVEDFKYSDNVISGSKVVLRVPLGDPIRPDVSEVIAGQHYLEASFQFSVDMVAGLPGNNEYDWGLVWIVTGDYLREDGVVVTDRNGPTGGIQIGPVAPISVTDAVDSTVIVTPRLDFASSFTVAENYASTYETAYGLSPDDISSIFYNNTYGQSESNYANYKPYAYLALVRRPKIDDGRDNYYWKVHGETYGECLLANVLSRPGFNVYLPPYTAMS